MSFLSVLKRVGTVALGVEHIAAQVVPAFVPGSGAAFSIIDSIAGHVQSSIIAQEVASPDSGSGAMKAAAVQSDFELALFDNLLAPVLAARGETVSYDHVALAEGISGFVAALNAMSKVKASIKIVPIVKPA